VSRRIAPQHAGAANSARDNTTPLPIDPSERPIHATINGAAQVNNQEDLALHVLVVTADLGGAMLANGIRLVAAVLDSVGAVVTRRADIRYASLLAWTLHADGP